MDKVAMWSSPDHRRIDLQIPRHVLDVHNRTIDDVPSHAMLVSDDSFAYHRFDTIAADHHVRLEAAAVLVADSGTCFILQIGRASCREGVCQYVSISVVAVS